jgi:hypothetical protein
MKQSQLYSVVTTIQAPTPAMHKLGRALQSAGARLLVAGDRKGPFKYDLPGAELLTLEQQLALPCRLASLLPVNHYVRKNLGYLVAISRGASCVYETDDDNAPNTHWKPRFSNVKAVSVRKTGWHNVYDHFSKTFLWPRGFPLERIEASRKTAGLDGAALKSVFSPIQQGLADGNPDVDAIWRLVQSSDIRFARKKSLALERNVWCPFNSQTTWWWPEVYPLLYLPSFCTFRMTDIWRSFIAQRCVWELGGVVTFHAPEVFQDRNEHDLLRDFQDEVPGYLGNGKISQTLERLELRSGPDSVPRNMLTCYEALVSNGVFPKKELRLLKAWLFDFEKVSAGMVL